MVKFAIQLYRIMLVDRETKIAELIAKDIKVIDVIASINKHFKKLKNPILRKVLASRVSVADAAKVGGVPTHVFFEKLKKAGFKIEEEAILDVLEETKVKKFKPIKMTTKIIRLDVRPIIEGGNDPFKEIMVAIKNLKLDETLEVINSFEPIPLINKLKKQGFNTWTERSKTGVVHTFFKKESTHNVPEKESSIDKTSFEDFTKKLQFFEGKLKTIDVRHLEMPEPMVTILQEIEVLPNANALFVEHKKIPQFLLPELKERNFEILYRKQSENHFQLLIFKY